MELYKESLPYSWNCLFSIDGFTIEKIGEAEYIGCYVMNGILVINSINVNGELFSIGIRRKVMKIIKDVESVIISSSIGSMKIKMLTRYGFVYNEDKRLYSRGVEWEK